MHTTKDTFTKEFQKVFHIVNFFDIWGHTVSEGGFPIKIETEISSLISYSFAIFIV